MTSSAWILAADDDALIPARAAKAALRERGVEPEAAGRGYTKTCAAAAHNAYCTRGLTTTLLVNDGYDA